MPGGIEMFCMLANMHKCKSMDHGSRSYSAPVCHQTDNKNNSDKKIVLFDYISYFIDDVWVMKLNWMFSDFSAQSPQSQASKVDTFLDKPFVDMDTNACHFMTCPLQANVKQTYTYTLNINKTYPAVSICFWHHCFIFHVLISFQKVISSSFNIT